jgi:aspartate/methionine/tyrosine aminotransferase
LAAVALEHVDAVLARSLEIVRGNLALVDEWIASEPRLRYVRPRAGTTALVRYDHAVPSVEFCQQLFDLNGAFVMPGVAFGEEHSFRLGYACAREVLAGGLAAVSAYLRTIE